MGMNDGVNEGWCDVQLARSMQSELTSTSCLQTVEHRHELKTKTMKSRDTLPMLASYGRAQDGIGKAGLWMTARPLELFWLGKGEVQMGLK